MATHTGAATESPFDIHITSVSTLEPDLQRGRKRRRDFFGMSTGRTTSPLGESATFRGRCRYRSSSRYMDMMSLSRPTSQARMLIGECHRRNISGSPSPSRRKMIRILQFVGTRRRNQPPSRSQSPYTSYQDIESAQELFRRRRQRTQSRSRAPSTIPANFGMSSHSGDHNHTAIEAVMLPLIAYKLAESSESPTREETGRRG